MNFAKKLASLRKQKGLSQKELSERLGVSWQNVAKWEANQSTPSAEDLMDIGDFFGVTVDCLLKEDGPPITLMQTEPQFNNSFSSHSHQDFVFCTQCGKQNQGGSRFCAHCGSPISIVCNSSQNTPNNGYEYAYYQANLQLQQEALKLEQERIMLERRRLEVAKNQASDQKQLVELQQRQYDELARCPRCGSTSLSSNKKGYGVGKGLIGAALFGPVGLLAGGLGANKVVATCMNCGHKFTPRKTY